VGTQVHRRSQGLELTAPMSRLYPQPSPQAARRLFHGVVAGLVVGVIMLIGAANTLAWQFPPTYTSKNYAPSSGYTPYGVVMNGYGTLMFTLTNYSGSSYRVEKYFLSTPWDITTAVYITAKNLTVTNTPKLAFLTEDGTKMYILEGANWDMKEFTMSTAWDISTLTNTETDVPCGNYYPLAASFALGGTHYAVYCGDGTNRSYDLTTAWDLHSGAATASVDFGAGHRLINFAWSDDGVNVFADVINWASGNGTDDYFLQLYCSTPYNITTCAPISGDAVSYTATEGGGSNYDGLWASLDADYVMHYSAGDAGKHIWQWSIASGTTWSYTGIYPPSGSYEFERTASTSTWWGNIIYDVGRMFSDIFKYLFIPDSTELDYWTQLKTLAQARAPISYVSQFNTIITTAAASSSAFPSFGIDLEPYGIHASPSLFSLTAVRTYLPTNLLSTFQTLILTALWLTLAFHMFHEVRGLI
jgi:hypothetical protein